MELIPLLSPSITFISYKNNFIMVKNQIQVLNLIILQCLLKVKNMKLKILNILILILIISGLGGIYADPSDPLQNGSFENGYSEWTSTSGATTSTTESYSGDYSMRFRADYPDRPYIKQTVNYGENEFDLLRFYAIQPASGDDGYLIVTITYIASGQTKTKIMVTSTIYTSWEEINFPRSLIPDSSIEVTEIKIQAYEGESDWVYVYVDLVTVSWSPKGGGGGGGGPPEFDP